MRQWKSKSSKNSQVLSALEYTELEDINQTIILKKVVVSKNKILWLDNTRISAMAS